MNERWEPWEDDLIRKYYPEHGADWKGDGPRDGWGYHLAGRTPKAIRGRACALKVRFEPSKRLFCLWQYGECKGVATMDEWAEMLGIKKETVQSYACPSMQGTRRGLVLERVER